MYFQLRGLPSATHSTAYAMRRARVASCFASRIHSMYSRYGTYDRASRRPK